MTNRERNLLVLFFAVLAAAGLMVALNSYFGEMSSLDAEFAALQQRAVRTSQANLLAAASNDSTSALVLKRRFFAPGSLPEPLALATLAQTSLKASGLSLIESRITESSATAQWVRYSVEGDIDAWFRFLQTLRQKDPRALFRSLSMVEKNGYEYAIAFEVGHVVTP